VYETVSPTDVWLDHAGMGVILPRVGTPGGGVVAPPPDSPLHITLAPGIYSSTMLS